MVASFVLVACDDTAKKCEHVDADYNGKCDKCGEEVAAIAPTEDYVAQCTLDRASGTNQIEVTVKMYVDGDTTHFNVPTSVVPTGTLKARYLAVNTPESTGQIEDYGKTASRFTQSKLSSATSIIVESEDNKWNLDSTGDRYLVWVWYKPAGESDYRNLNLELLQEGLAKPSSARETRYGELCMSALNQATAARLYIHSGINDPEVPRGSAIEITLRELRTNVSQYSGKKVAFDGVITRNSDNTAYIEEFDAETGIYYAMPVYLGFGLPGKALEILAVGNRVRMVGVVQYWEAGETYQISGLTYNIMKPKAPDNVQRLDDEKHEPGYYEATADEFVNGKVTVVIGEDSEEEQTKKLPFAELALSTTISMKNLTVKSIYTTSNPESSSKGAMTITCENVDGIEVIIRTTVLVEDGVLVTADRYEGETIDVKGVVDCYEGEYQIKVLSSKDIIIH